MLQEPVPRTFSSTKIKIKRIKHVCTYSVYYIVYRCYQYYYEQAFDQTKIANVPQEDDTGVSEIVSPVIILMYLLRLRVEASLLCPSKRLQPLRDF